MSSTASEVLIGTRVLFYFILIDLSRILQLHWFKKGKCLHFAVVRGMLVQRTVDVNMLKGASFCELNVYPTCSTNQSYCEIHMGLITLVVLFKQLKYSGILKKVIS